MKSEKEVLNALNTIMDVCKEHNGQCKKCILRNADDYCGVLGNSRGDSYESPVEWVLKNDDNPRVILS